jgi:hypothetical protein
MEEVDVFARSKCKKSTALKTQSTAQTCRKPPLERNSVTDSEVDFTAQATLRKWPSIGRQRNPSLQYNSPYLLHQGTLDECISEFMFKDIAYRHLYEIHTNAQPPLVTEVLLGDHIVELSRLRDFL